MLKSNQQSILVRVIEIRKKILSFVSVSSRGKWISTVQVLGIYTVDNRGNINGIRSPKVNDNNEEST